MSGAQTNKILEAIRLQVASRALGPGEKLDSIRRFAVKMGVSASTVADAYDRLVAEGLIHSRPCSGFYVSDTSTPLTLTAIAPVLSREIDPLWVSRQSLDADTNMLKPGCGWLPADWMPHEALRKAMRKLARADDALLTDYGNTKGSFALRQLLARQLAEEGVSASAEHILLTASATQAIDLICRMLLRPGDTVVVDDPCYFNFQALLKAHQVNVVAVNYTSTGPDIDAFEHAVHNTAPQMYITNSALHNPTGGTLSAQTAHRILKCATANRVTVVEDNIFSGFEPTLSARYAALDGLQQVIRIGSFSKTLSASVRCGYIVANPDWLEALVDLQVATNFGGPSPVAAELLYLALSDGSYRKHMDSLRVRLAKARRQATTKLERIGVQPWLVPRGGFYLWCCLPNHRDSADIARAALSEQIVLAPGNVFSPSQSKANFMRFNVSQMLEPRIFSVLERLLKQTT